MTVHDAVVAAATVEARFHANENDPGADATRPSIKS
jgi:hypothetical protein